MFSNSWKLKSSQKLIESCLLALVNRKRSGISTCSEWRTIHENDNSFWKFAEKFKILSENGRKRKSNKYKRAEIRVLWSFRDRSEIDKEEKHG